MHAGASSQDIDLKKFYSVRSVRATGLSVSRRLVRALSCNKIQSRQVRRSSRYSRRASFSMAI